MPAFRRAELWSDLAAASGARLAAIPDVASLDETRRTSGDDELKLTLPVESVAYAQVKERRALRVVYVDDTFDEWRILGINESRSSDNAKVGVVSASSPLVDLSRTLVSRTEADGLVHFDFDGLQLTPTEQINSLILPALTADGITHFALGTIDPTWPVDQVYQWSTPLAALRQLADTTGCELRVRRNGTTNYLIDILTAIGSGAATVDFRIGKNIKGIARDRSSTEQFTRVYPRGQVDEFGATMARAVWEVVSVAGSVVRLKDSAGGDGPAQFADQMNGTYLRKASGTLTLVSVTAVISVLLTDVTVADATSITVGDLLQFRKNAGGDDLTYLEAPAQKTAYGLIAGLVDRPDIPATWNQVKNPSMRVWTGISTVPPDNWTKLGTPTLTKTTTAARWRMGGQSCRVQASSDGDGLETIYVPVSPSAAMPYFSGFVSVWLETGGQVRVELVATGGELVVNGDGETGTVGSQAPSWFFGAGNALNVANDFVHGGAKSLKIVNATAVDSYSLQNVSIVGGRTYRLSGWIKTDALPLADAGFGAVINIDTVSGIGSYAIVSKTTFGDPDPTVPDIGRQADNAVHDWTYVECLFIPAQDGVVSVYCQLGYSGGQSGTAWFDDVSLKLANPYVFPDAVQKAYTSQNKIWVDLGVAGIDLQRIAATQVKIRVVQDGTAAADFYVDAAQIAQWSTQLPYIEGSGGTKLWQAANDLLFQQADPLIRYDIDVLDLTRLNPGAWPNDDITLGGTVKVKDTGLGVDGTTRVLEIRRDLLIDASTAVVLSSRPDDLTDNLVAPRPKPRRDTNPGTDVGRLPEVLSITLTVNSAGNVLATVQGNRNTGSMRLVGSKTNYPTLSDVQLQFPQAGRNVTELPVIDVATGVAMVLGFNEICKLSVVSYSLAGAAGYEGPLANGAVRSPLAMRRSIFISGTTFTVPSDWNNSNNTIEGIGGGAGGGAGVANTRGAGGGGGGMYKKKNNVSLTLGASVAFAIGGGGGAGVSSGQNGGAGGNTTFATTTMVASGGGAPSGATAGAGGTGGTGDVGHDGAAGAAGQVGTTASGGRGGGAGGPSTAGSGQTGGTPSDPWGTGQGPGNGGNAGTPPTPVNGIAGAVYGGGGGGGACIPATFSQGAAGAQGILVITWYA
jgi:phage minor structural protein